MGYRRGNAVQRAFPAIHKIKEDRNSIRLFSVKGCCFSVMICALAFCMGWLTRFISEPDSYPPLEDFEEEYRVHLLAQEYPRAYLAALARRWCFLSREQIGLPIPFVVCIFWIWSTCDARRTRRSFAVHAVEFLKFLLYHPGWSFLMINYVSK